MTGRARRGFALVVLTLVVIVLALVVSGCGDTAKSTGTGVSVVVVSPTAPPAAEKTQTSPPPLPKGQTVRSDGDADNPADIDGNPDPDTTDQDNDSYTPQSYLYPDSDDTAVFRFGHSPTPAQRRSIVAVVSGYDAAATAADGSVACALMDPSLARSAPEDYGSSAGLPYLHGAKTCATLMSALFRHEHAQLRDEAKLLSVRVQAGVAQVVLGSRTMRAGLLHVMREGHRWYVEGLLASPLP